MILRETDNDFTDSQGDDNANQNRPLDSLAGCIDEQHDGQGQNSKTSPGEEPGGVEATGNPVGPGVVGIIDSGANKGHEHAFIGQQENYRAEGEQGPEQIFVGAGQEAVGVFVSFGTSPYISSGS